MAQKLDPVPLAPAAPGIAKSASPLSLSNRWIDGDKVRFVADKPEKIGGFAKLTVTSVGAQIRGVLPWYTMQLNPFIALGTHRKLYVVDQSFDPVNITPIVDSGTLTDPFTTTAGSSSVLVEHEDHGLNVGDSASFPDGSTEVGGITISGEYIIVSVLDSDNYYIEHTTVAADADAGGGSVNYEYELPIGAEDPLEGDGFGAGGFGLGDYGEPSETGAGSVIFEPRIWNLANYGDLLLANPVNGGIYQFDPDEAPAYQRAEPLLNAPTVCRSMFVTEERFIFALGVDNDPMNIKWPDQDDPTNWTPGIASTANSRRLTSGTRIIAGTSIASFLSGVWTDTSLYQFQYTGSSFIYESKPVGTNCGLVSPLALVRHLSIAYWMSQNNFHMWGGGAPQAIPNVEDIREFVFNALRGAGYEFKCNAHLNSRYNELWWFYVPEGSSEPGLYVAVALDGFAWICGTMERTSGAFFEASDLRPILAGADGYLYRHDEGKDADGAIMQAYLKRAPLQIANGARLGEITGMVNDMERQIGSMAVQVDMYDRLKEGVMDTETVTFEPDESLVDLHIGGRVAGITLRSAALGGDFRLGAPMLEVSATGARR